MARITGAPIARLVTSLTTACLLLAAALTLLAVVDTPTSARAQAGSGLVRVATTGIDTPDCGSVISPCRTIQHAVDLAATGDTVLAAAGVYTGVLARGGAMQLVYISKTITILGGYSTANGYAEPPDADTFPVILDAQSGGRMFNILGDMDVLLEGLQVVNGHAGIGEPSNPSGGGAAVVTAATTFSGCRIAANSAITGVGGGLYFRSSPSTVVDSHVLSNAASYGGGVALDNSPVSISGSVVAGNTATAWGGGLNIYQSDHSRLVSSHVFSNEAGVSGGGLNIFETRPFTASGSSVYDNVAQENGGGVELYSSTVQFTANELYGNRAVNVSGGGINIFRSQGQIYDCGFHTNTASINGGGLFLNQSTLTVVGNRFYSNTADNGAGLKLEFSPARILSNTIQDNFDANFGGGMDVYSSTAEVVGNRVFSNTAGSGGGIVIYQCDGAVVSGNQVAYNRTIYDGAGIRLHESHQILVFSNTV